MRAADHLIELGPRAGSNGGNLVFSGAASAIGAAAHSLTGDYLSGRRTLPPPKERRPVPVKKTRAPVQSPTTPPGKTRAEFPRLEMSGITCHNLDGLDVVLPLRRFVCLAGVSGSGKSTLLNHALHQGLLEQQGRVAQSPARIRKTSCDLVFDEIELVDQSPLSRTPRSNPALYVGAWDAIRKLFAGTDAARTAGLTASHFSFNSGTGRCDHCQGLGYERVEMQFLSDVFVPCPVCDGKRFKPEILDVRWQGASIDEVLRLDIASALDLFKQQAAVRSRLQALADVGLHYLTLGQPLNTLSGGESQRLKLVRYLSSLHSKQEAGSALILLDEPTTGLHRHDVKTLLAVLQKLVDAGHSLIVIEHNLDVLLAADWILELGPEAGQAGGRLVAAGTPEHLARGKTATAGFLRRELNSTPKTFENKEAFPALPTARASQLEAAEAVIPFDPADGSNGARVCPLELTGAREHNLRNLSLSLPPNEFTVVTGVSGSGKSSLAFDIVFAEGQRRYMESISAYARQFIEQLPKPDIDRLSGIPPTVAIEQRVTHGTRKSTVATITEVAQYLRLLFARIGVQHSVATGEALTTASPDSLRKFLLKRLGGLKGHDHLYLCAPLIRGRKGHHEPVANWAADHGYELLRIDAQLVRVADFKRLDRYREHDIELAVADFGTKGNANGPKAVATALETALRLGKGSAFLLSGTNELLFWLSTSRTDPATGEAYPELDPKHFSWNSPRGWCPACRGYGYIGEWMAGAEEFDQLPNDAQPGELCPECGGDRLNATARAVYVQTKNGRKLNLPGLLRETSTSLVATLAQLRLDKRERAIATDVLPQIEERLRFMDEVGLSYLSLDRSTITLSGGEAQRIRLAAQLGSNLSGVLYVLDEPSIGLHARDNQRLIESIRRLQKQGNSLLVVEHDDDTMRAADRIIDLGPGAGLHGGEILANGSLEAIRDNPASLTARYLREGIAHPLLGERRPLPPAFKARAANSEWLVARNCRLRNLKDIELHIPRERLTVVCGISGAGKSTLVRDLVKPAVEQAIRKRARRLTGREYAEQVGLPIQSLPLRDLYHGNAFRSVVEVDQEPIGKTPRSTPATYMGAFDLIRELFARLPEARMRGFTPSTFSFNTKGGRCETCKGAGRVKLEMNFLPDTWVDCEDCGRFRYGPELADITLRGKNIADVLAMSFEEAAAFFASFDRLRDRLQLMVDTGLGYLTLGQSSPTLSGGEAQRLKLVTELAKGLPTFKDRSTGRQRQNLYILEEPTIGLHLADVEKLLQLLHRLTRQGHTVIVIEHHLDIIADADYLVEIGPEGGEAGGHLLFQGTPEELAGQDTPTAPFMREKLGKGG